MIYSIVGSWCDWACSLYGRSVALIACASERTMQYNHRCFRSLVTVVYDHRQSFSPVICYSYLSDCRLPPCPFTCIYCFLSMYLSMLMYALAPQHLTLCARQVVLWFLSILASYAVCQSVRPAATSTSMGVRTAILRWIQPFILAVLVICRETQQGTGQKLDSGSKWDTHFCVL